MSIVKVLISKSKSSEISNLKILKDNNVDYYVVPENIANKTIEEKHQLWLSGKKKSGEARKSQVRTFGMNTIPNFEDYKNEKGWEKLKNSIK